MSSNTLFCVAVLNAGYHVELRAGGLHSEAIFRSTVVLITEVLLFCFVFFFCFFFFFFF
jgi:enoyl reductase-like protein